MEMFFNWKKGFILQKKSYFEIEIITAKYPRAVYTGENAC